MTDLEMTKLCAEAMGIEGHPVRDGQEMWSPEGWEKNKDAIMTHCWPFQIWNPLHDDAQAMALVKKLMLSVGRNQGVEWDVENRHSPFGEQYVCVMNKDLNRAVVECVAKMQETKTA